MFLERVGRILHQKLVGAHRDAVADGERVVDTRFHADAVAQRAIEAIEVLNRVRLPFAPDSRMVTGHVWRAIDVDDEVEVRKIERLGPAALPVASWPQSLTSATADLHVPVDRDQVSAV